MLSRLMKERGDLLLLFIQLQHKTTLKYVMKPIRSTLMMKYFVKNGKSITVHDENHEPMMVNEADMDFRIPGLPHSVVKHAQSTSVRQLIQKIENHPDRHALQKDLQQNQSFNLFSPESKDMIHEVGYIELRELFETDPKTQCKECLSYWNIGIIPCTCGHFLHKEKETNQQSSIIRWTLFQFLSTSSRKDDLTDIDVVKSRETRNTIRLAS